MVQSTNESDIQMKVHLIDVGSGNIRSLENAIKFLGYELVVVRSGKDASLLDQAEKVLLPGVGNFGHFMDQVHARGLAEPILEYARSDKPLMGICVGLQSVFDHSTEAPTSKGLGILTGGASKFDTSKKSVPHIGWNDMVISGDKELYGINPSRKYYFVHSYAIRVPDQSSVPVPSGWDYALCTYKDEIFLGAIAHGNKLFTQFHPEKSGQAGLDVIKSFLEGKHWGVQVSNYQSTGLTKRVIACLDVRANDQGDIVVTKGDQYDVREKTNDAGVRNLGKPVEVAQTYYEQGADEVTFLNIVSFRNSPLKDQPMVKVLNLASETVFVPVTIGGGIKDIQDPISGDLVPALDVASLYFRSGADKVSIGSDAVDAAQVFYAHGKTGKSPIETISRAYGAQAVVVSIDPKRVYVPDPSKVKHHTFQTAYQGQNGEEYVWYQCTVKGGRETRDIGAWELARAVESLGAGEILLNCIDKDGTNSGFDLELVQDIKTAVSIPVISSSGAGKPDHFVEVFEKTDVDAALGAGMFHRKEYSVADVKHQLAAKGFIVRLT